ncbi:hypothetical protein Tcan_17473 [Toxocara canis]|uniref:Uncharacterized protein n=1 Tax=Toxocara canis TaxID=6265 RepID=A0A0B2VPV9_TOXCA|nr:hypothetical protein Tcan_17473 [Toxocara canis]
MGAKTRPRNRKYVRLNYLLVKYMRKYQSTCALHHGNRTSAPGNPFDSRRLHCIEEDYALDRDGHEHGHIPTFARNAAVDMNLALRAEDTRL